MVVKNPSNEHRWTAGSYAAAGFALFILLYNLFTTIYITTLPSDGWLISGNYVSAVPTATFSQYFLNTPTPLMAGDEIVSVNGRTIKQILDAGHDFLNIDPPNWPDGTQLTYEIIRGGEHLTVDVTVRRTAVWEYYVGNLTVGRNSDRVMMFTGLFFFLIGCFVFLLRPANRAAHALLFIGAGFFPFVGNYSILGAFYPHPPPSIPFDNWTFVLIPSLIYLVLAFPYPKAVLRRFPRMTVLLTYLPWPIIFNLAYLLNMQDRVGYFRIAFAIYPIQIAILMLTTIAALTHTILTVRDPVGRSQLKWMLAGVGSFVFIGIGGWVISSYFFPNTMLAGNWLITTIGWLLMPICLAVAITRYHLFDIDLIIRRTLQYSLLTGLLALVYYGGTVLLQWAFSGIDNLSNSPAVIVLSTLGIAALFNPLRYRLQNIIDRRFYRQKYDTENVLATFSSTLRNEMELDYLSSSIMSVVDDIIQPEHVSLWFCQTPEKDQSGGEVEA